MNFHVPVAILVAPDAPAHQFEKIECISYRFINHLHLNSRPNLERFPGNLFSADRMGEQNKSLEKPSTDFGETIYKD